MSMGHQVSCVRCQVSGKKLGYFEFTWQLEAGSWNLRVCILSALMALASICLLIPLFAHAQGFVPLAQVPPNSKFGQLTASRDFSGFVNGLFKFGIAIGAIAAVLRLAYAGYLYMGQSDMWSQKGVAKGIMQDVTIGLLLLLSIYLILFQINPDILKLSALQRITPVSQPGQQ